ncbi:hypothetical protein BX661DRAFT_180081 [Kickxella alabastrina]|uniref:uncharacterized protein n=1 Tax=Kickxella alabastrina TaxID=61397 RepID=UPI0022204604|nr:uncharacterized protein BX661DRAFT_180081 [Kickxella alabastrina]KAI7830786.1 hypothetical protein BX661DRAFT_180081 [Kickxella alabastrina]
MAVSAAVIAAPIASGLIFLSILTSDIYPPPTEPPATLQTIYVQETHAPPLGLSPGYAAPTGNAGHVFSGVTPFDFNRANRINRAGTRTWVRQSGDGGEGGGDGGGGGGGDGGC